jgi:hypothetical protein
VRTRSHMLRTPGPPHMIAIQPVEHLIEAVLGGDRHMAVRLFDLIFDPLRHGGRSAMCGFGFGEKPLDALLGSAEVLRPFSDRNNVLHALRDPAHSTTLP